MSKDLSFSNVTCAVVGGVIGSLLGYLYADSLPRPEPPQSLPGYLYADSLPRPEPPQTKRLITFDTAFPLANIGNLELVSQQYYGGRYHYVLGV